MMILLHARDLIVGLSADKYSSIINKTVKKDLKKDQKFFKRSNLND